MTAPAVVSPACSAPSSPPRRARLQRARWQYGALAGILALSALLGVHRLDQNGYANTFYSAGVKSMLRSWHNFLFLSFDPGGLVTLDKPPLGVWIQVASAKLFGFSPLSLLLPEAIIATVTVGLLYRILARRLGAAAGLAGALALAVFPSFVAVSRDNGPDPLLIMLMLLACGAALNAIETGRRRSLIGSVVWIALAFNTKTLAAYLLLPGLALAYLVCAPGSARRRGAMVAAAAAVTAIGSFSWIALVDLTPASQRPYVGDSTDNTELGLTFSYNGLGRVADEQRAPRTVHESAAAPVLPDGRLRYPITSGGATGPLRLFGPNLSDQGAWMLPFALVGMVAFALLVVGDERRTRRDPRLALLFVLGGWLVCEVAILNFSSGIVHPYYVSAVAPGAAAMVSAGALAFTRLATRRERSAVLLPCAVAATVAVQTAILNHQGYMRSWPPALIAAAVLGTAAIARGTFAPVAMGGVLAVLLVAPGGYAATTWRAPGDGTFPAAGPHQAAGRGTYGIDAPALRADRDLIAYVTAHRSGSRWALLTVTAPTAAPLILLGVPAGAMGGYGGTDPALDGPGLARLVARGWARYVVLGGLFASRGGNLASRAVPRSCRRVPRRVWQAPARAVSDLVLFDCAGRERALSGR